jgi:hypothetical protein
MKATAKIDNIRSRRQSLKKRKIWLDAYNAEMAKHNQTHVYGGVGYHRGDARAKRAADIAALYGATK